MQKQKIVKVFIACFSAVLLLGSCASQNGLTGSPVLKKKNKYLSPNGDVAEIVLRNDAKFVAELLAVQDSSVLLYFKIGDAKIAGVHIDDLKSITIKGYSNRTWVVPLVLFEFIPAILLGIAAGQVEDVEPLKVFLVASILPILNFAVFEASTPDPPKFEFPFTPKKLDRLYKYTRFPQGLSPEQIKRLLLVYGQSRIRQLNK